MRIFTLVFLAFVLGFALAAEGEKHALLIGVQQYSDDELGNLQYSENDVKELADVLKNQGYLEGNVHLLTVSNAKATDIDNLRPTAKNIASWLKYLCKNAKPQDTVLVAFAGHGIELKDADGKFRSFFCPLEASLKDEKTLVPIIDFYNDLDVKCKAHVKLMVMDACRKSRFSRDTSLTMPLIPDPPGGIVAFYSCGKGQKAYESDVFKHGIFFHYFIEGLKGACANADGEVTLPLLEDYVTRQVPRAVVQEQKNPDAEQYPERRGQILGQLVLATAQKAAPVAPVSPPPSSVVAVRPPENGNELTIDLGKGVTMEFVRVTAGTFKMGSEDSDADASSPEKPAHTVKLSKDYYIGKYPVTVGQFKRFVEESGYQTNAEKSKGGVMFANKELKAVEGMSWKSPGFEQGNDHPVVQVSLNDVEAFLLWACTQCKREVRLPTEAEWEYAARGPKNLKYPWGNYFDGSKCNHADLTFKISGVAPESWGFTTVNDGSVFTTPVGHFGDASWCGAKDMAGNIDQWCHDKYDEKYYLSRPFIDTDPKGPSAGDKFKSWFDDVEQQAFVTRGGSWMEGPIGCRSTRRTASPPLGRGSSSGFRCVMPVD